MRDSLRHWAQEYDVDGFCFVNAETMAQGELPLLATGAKLACASFACYGFIMRCPGEHEHGVMLMHVSLFGR